MQAQKRKTPPSSDGEDNDHTLTDTRAKKHPSGVTSGATQKYLKTSNFLTPASKEKAPTTPRSHNTIAQSNIDQYVVRPT